MTTAPQPSGMSRNEGLGSSEVAAALGLNPYCTPWQVWAEKQGLVDPFEGNPATEWGTIMEPVIAAKWESVTGRLCWPAETVTHGNGWAFASADRVAEREDKTGNEIIEIKTARYSDGWGDDGSDVVPRHYLIQWHWQSAILGIDRGEIVVLIGGNDFRRYPMKASPKLQAAIMEKASAWWQRHMIDGEPPEMKGGDEERKSIGQVHDATDGDIRNDGPATDQIVEKYRLAKQQAAAWTRLASARENEVRWVIGNSAGIEGPGYKITYKFDKRGRRTMRATFTD